MVMFRLKNNGAFPSVDVEKDARKWSDRDILTVLGYQPPNGWNGKTPKCLFMVITRRLSDWGDSYNYEKKMNQETFCEEAMILRVQKTVIGICYTLIEAYGTYRANWWPISKSEIVRYLKEGYLRAHANRYEEPNGLLPVYSEQEPDGIWDDKKIMETLHIFASPRNGNGTYISGSWDEREKESALVVTVTQPFKRAMVLHFLRKKSGNQYRLIPACGMAFKDSVILSEQEIAKMIVNGEIYAEQGRYRVKGAEPIPGTEWSKIGDPTMQIAQQLVSFAGIPPEEAVKMAVDPMYCGPEQ